MAIVDVEHARDLAAWSGRALEGSDKPALVARGILLIMDERTP